MKNRTLLYCATALILATSQLQAQTRRLPPIFDSTPVKLAKSTIIASFPRKTFLENITVDDAGNLLVTDLDEGIILKIKPDGHKETFARLNGRVAGIVAYPAHGYLLTAWDDAGKAAVFLLDNGRKVSKLANIEGAMFLNGITLLTGNTFLIADSYKGCIWAFDANTKQATVWLADTLLERADLNNPTPGVNGLKIRKGILYASNTQRQQLFRIPIQQQKPGAIEQFVNKVNLDDFAFDQQGNLYSATHIYNRVVKITPAGQVTVIAETKEGVSGATSLAFGRQPGDRSSIYVITNGGTSFPPPGGIEEAKVVRLSLN